MSARFPCTVALIGSASSHPILPNHHVWGILSSKSHGLEFKSKPLFQRMYLESPPGTNIVIPWSNILETSIANVYYSYAIYQGEYVVVKYTDANYDMDTVVAIMPGWGTAFGSFERAKGLQKAIWRERARFIGEAQTKTKVKVSR